MERIFILYIYCVEDASNWVRSWAKLVQGVWSVEASPGNEKSQSYVFKVEGVERSGRGVKSKTYHNSL